MSVLAAVYYHTDRLSEAEDCAHKSVELAEAAIGLQHPRLAFYLVNYATILREMSRKSEAKGFRREPLCGNGVRFRKELSASEHSRHRERLSAHE